MKRTPWIVSAGLALGAGTANAALILTEADIATPTSVITFDDHPTQEITLGPVQVGTSVGRDVVFTATSTFDAAGFTAGLYGFGSNGVWNDAMTSTWVNGGPIATMRFTFGDAPVSAVGAFMNYCINFGQAGCGTNGVSLSALDSSFNVLESYRLDLLAPISTPAATNAGEFRGISRGTADIYAFEFSGGGMFDNLVFTNPPRTVPEPATIGLLAFGLLAMALLRRKRLA